MSATGKKKQAANERVWERQIKMRWKGKKEKKKEKRIRPRPNWHPTIMTDADVELFSFCFPKKKNKQTFLFPCFICLSLSLSLFFSFILDNENQLMNFTSSNMNNIYLNYITFSVILTSYISPFTVQTDGNVRKTWCCCFILVQKKHVKW